MFSVSRDLFEALSLAARYLFALLLLSVTLRALAGHWHAERDRKDRLRNLPGAGTVGELVVVSGNDELPAETWLPVPREGVLGAVRSCDLVVPCAGVRKHHLDFVWQDGVGLLLSPRSGCEVFVNSLSLDGRSDPRNAPLTHSACLTVGSAVLRFLVFAALSAGDVSGEAAPQPAGPAPFVYSAPPPAYVPPPAQAAGFFPNAAVPAGSLDPVFSASPMEAPVPFPGEPLDGDTASQAMVAEYAPGADAPHSPSPRSDNAPAAHMRRSDRWKEDWSE